MCCDISNLPKMYVSFLDAVPGQPVLLISEELFQLSGKVLATEI